MMGTPVTVVAIGSARRKVTETCSWGSALAEDMDIPAPAGLPRREITESPAERPVCRTLFDFPLTPPRVRNGLTAFTSESSNFEKIRLQASHLSSEITHLLPRASGKACAVVRKKEGPVWPQ